MLGLLLVLGLLIAVFYNWIQVPLVRFNLQVGQCKFGPPLAGVYLPERLQVLDRCSTVSGTVDCLRAEPDGDLHIRLRLDPPFEAFLRPANSLQTCADHPGPHLVIEIIPQHSHGLLFRENNADAGGFLTPSTPDPGSHIKVTGPHVIDKNLLHRVEYQGRPAENWAEIHPAWAILVDRPGRQPNNYGPDFGE